ncbi:hypothetical protein JQ580_26700 [Bradyrhizobium japonicum]|uniref:alpha/beta hydrolase n=1 Tax=Bradyrhizobium japonicum TaxID=375 RepID=UPI001BA78EC6|nr:hypothetical protein [Bradyrhizobium japonicum]
MPDLHLVYIGPRNVTSVLNSANVADASENRFRASIPTTRQRPRNTASSFCHSYGSLVASSRQSTRSPPGAR